MRKRKPFPWNNLSKQGKLRSAWIEKKRSIVFTFGKHFIHSKRDSLLPFDMMARTSASLLFVVGRNVTSWHITLLLHLAIASSAVWTQLVLFLLTTRLNPPVKSLTVTTHLEASCSAEKKEHPTQNMLEITQCREEHAYIIPTFSFFVLFCDITGQKLYSSIKVELFSHLICLLKF